MTTTRHYSQPSKLAALRKKTGYSISHCKKALEVTGNQDIEKAESWLNSQAQAQGWDKAAKLQNRATLNGLIGITFNSREAFMVEVNCETDFVARNEKFQNFVVQVATTTSSCLKDRITGVPGPSQNSSNITEVKLTSEQLGALRIIESGKSLADLLAINIGLIGENMSLRRAVAFCAPNDPNIKLACCSHPVSTNEGTLLGKYGAIVAYIADGCSNGPVSENCELPEGVTLEKLPKQLCQHVIGMNPRIVERIEGSTEEKDLILLEQDFVANPEYRVGEVLNLAGWKVKGFLRLECGETQE